MFQHRVTEFLDLFFLTHLVFIYIYLRYIEQKKFSILYIFVWYVLYGRPFQVDMYFNTIYFFILSFWKPNLSFGTYEIILQ